MQVASRFGVVCCLLRQLNAWLGGAGFKLTLGLESLLFIPEFYNLRSIFLFYKFKMHWGYRLHNGLGFGNKILGRNCQVDSIGFARGIVFYCYADIVQS